MKILIMGLPGSGKTTLAGALVKLINAEWLNADKIRKKENDWDFSEEGRKRQARRMCDYADKLVEKGKIAVADFVCPLPNTRSLFKADYVVWVDTIKKGRFDDTNKLFVPPEKYNIRITTQDAELWSKKISKEIDHLLKKGKTSS